jgi:hypothetical protein
VPRRSDALQDGGTDEGEQLTESGTRPRTLLWWGGDMRPLENTCPSTPVRHSAERFLLHL